jgi:plasmid stabilization system protein ParE
LRPYRYLEEADQEFQEHIGYFDSVSRAVALRFVDAVEAAINEIRQYPEIGAPITRLVRKRVLTKFKYNILYVNTSAEIIVIAIAPHRRRPGYWRKRLKYLNR